MVLHRPFEPTALTGKVNLARPQARGEEVVRPAATKTHDCKAHKAKPVRRTRRSARARRGGGIGVVSVSVLVEIVDVTLNSAAVASLTTLSRTAFVSARCRSSDFGL